MLEREIEKILVSEVKALGGRAYKFTSPGNDGVPDRMVCLPGGRICFVELKSEVGRLTPLQRTQITRLRELGQRVFIIRGLEGLADWFLEMRCPGVARKISERYDKR